MPTIRRTLPALLAALLAAGCGPKPGTVAVEQAWTRETAPGQSMAAVYFTISNDGAEDRLLAPTVVAPAGARASLHTGSMAGGVMRMRPAADGIAVPEGTTRLAPGGAHVMIEGLPGPLKAGGQLRLQLRFRVAGTRAVSVPVLPAGSAGPAA
ncbi:copper chaperone PCu(A)C [Sphingomonas ginkgonis]|nr:copper chaperone PCu(A)C [Sphingomonas ginkgonis]